MKKYYIINSDGGQRFETLSQVLLHVSLMEKNDALGYNDMFVLRVIEQDGRSLVDENFCRVINVKLDRDGYVKLKLSKV